MLGTMKKVTFQPLAQVVLVSGAVTVAITTAVICFNFRGFIDIQVAPQGGRLTIDSRQIVDKTEVPQLQVREKK